MAIQYGIKGKLIINAILTLETGLHIGAAKDFSPIGDVDSPFVRDPFTKQPVIPGSSVKGKMRTLLAKALTSQPDYLLNDITDDTEEVKRLFGSANTGSSNSSEQGSGIASRLQFYDLFMTKDSFDVFSKLDMDTYIGEIKFENTISRLTAVANPRQIERVPAGVEFAFKLVYNIENPEDIQKDMELVADGFKLLQMDYIGGSGSRGYGRISLHDFQIDIFSLQPDVKEDIKKLKKEIQSAFEGSRQ